MSKNFSMLIVLVLLSTSCLVSIKPVHPAYNEVENSWTTKTPMHGARSSLGVAVVNEKIYAIGGRTGNLGTGADIGFTGTNEEYNPTTDKWTFKMPMPTSRAYLAVVSYEKKIYCIGGVNVENGEYAALGTNEVYDPTTDSWETKASLPTPKLGATASVVSGKIFVMGGGSNVVEVYDPATDSWSEPAPIPVAPEAFYYGSCVSTVVDGEIHLIGAFPLENSHQVYNPETDSWRFGKPVVAGDYSAASAATTGVNAFRRIYVFGVDRTEWSQSLPEFTTQTYDPKTESWMAAASMPTGRLNVGVAVLNDMLYVIGGGTPGVTSGDHPTAVNEQYTPFGYGTPDPSPSPEPIASLEPSPTPTPSKEPTITPEPFPTTIVAVSAAVVTTVGLGLIVYFKKSKSFRE